MKYLIYFVTIIFLLSVNIGFFGQLPVWGQIPNLLLLLLINFSLDKKSFDFFFVALIAGLLVDFYSSTFFGGFTLGFLLVASFIYILANAFIFLEVNWKSLSILTFASLCVLYFTVWLYGFSVSKMGIQPTYIPFKYFLRNFPGMLIYNLILLFPMYLFSNWLKDFVNRLLMKSRGVVR